MTTEDAARPFPGPPERLERYIKDYRQYHDDHQKHLAGKVPEEKVAIIADLVNNLRSRVKRPRLLDYGSGKGYQYLRHRIQEAWGGNLPVCYDPGVIHLADRPTGLFHGIICTDVMEHIEEADLTYIITDIFDYLVEPGGGWYPFVYFHICCREARKYFPDGRNLHRTVQPPDWWEALFERHLLNRRSRGRKTLVNLVTRYEEAVEEVCALRTEHGEVICRNGVLWGLTYSEEGVPGKRRAMGPCPNCNEGAPT
jgi:hypothetical protein